MPKEKRISVAIVGTGLIGPRHAEAVVKDPSTLLLCIVDPSPEAEEVSKDSTYRSIEA